MVNEDIATTIALKVEVAALRGGGVDGEPYGVKNTTGINTVTTTSLNVTNGAAYISAVDIDNSLEGSLAWLMHPRPWYTYIGKYRTKGTEMLGVAQAGPSAAFPDTWLGFPVARSTNVKATTSGTTDVIFADWRQLLVGQWGGVSFAVSTEADTAFATNETWVRSIVETDIGVRNVESFCVNSSVTD
jgi:HK97 family phage major capsid protein